MLRSRFLWKLYASYAGLILLTTAVVGGLIARQIEQDSLREIQRSLHARAVLLKSLVIDVFESTEEAHVVESGLHERLRELSQELNTRFTVIRLNGIVVADSEEHSAEMDNHGSRPEVLAAASGEYGAATRFSRTVGVRMMYLALPVRSNGQLVGYVRTSLPLSVIDERISQLRAIITVGAGSAALAALLLGFVFARRFSAPLISMTSVAQTMAQGNYDQKLSITRSDEIGKLAGALNQMAKSARDRMDVIRMERNKLLAILAGMVEGVVAVDHEERVLLMNAAAGKILNSASEESLGKPIGQVVRVHEVCEMMTETLRSMKESERTIRLAVSLRDQTIEVHVSPLHDPEGKLAGAVVVLHDVSELHRLEQIRRDFVANVSHELKTPIAAVQGLVETVIDDRKMTDEDQERFLAKILNQSTRLSSIVTDLLALSRLESGNGMLETGSFDLAEVIRSAVTSLAQAAEERHIRVEVQLPKDPVRLLGDEDALSQVTSNLLDNALKYSPRGAEVWIRLRQENGQAVIEVQDQGAGIEPRDRDRIFERFYRVDKARSRELGGTGLGLSIVKHIVLAHGGEVNVESSPGAGSTFRVFLPVEISA